MNPSSHVLDFGCYYLQPWEQMSDLKLLYLEDSGTGDEA